LRNKFTNKRIYNENKNNCIDDCWTGVDNFDKEAFIKAVQKQALDRRAKREAIRKSRVKHLADFMEKIFNILTPEQRLKWIELAKQ
jgi:Spy/CpxP family protein refolding chaperone